MHRDRLVWAVFVISGLMTGCVPALPENTTATPPQRSKSAEAGGVVFWTEPGLENAVWAEIPRADGLGPLGGYLSQNDASRRSLIILLHGASTFELEGSTAAARRFHEFRGQPYRDAGYRTFSLDFRECGTAYGQGDVDDLLQLLAWLDAGGKEILDVDRVYTLGYSVGATAAILANRRHPVTAVAAVGGLTQPDQLEQAWSFYSLAAALFANNHGFCQLGTTLNAYGPPGSPGWEILDSVRHIVELQSPMIVVQGTEDQIYGIANARNLDAAYQLAVAAGVPLPHLEFLYLQGQDHFVLVDDPALAEPILTFFDAFGG